MFLPKKLLLRVLGVALVASPVVVACSAGDNLLNLSFDPPADASASDGGTIVVDADVPPTDGSPPPAQTCGNRKVDPGEECDDGNKANGDGCSATCKRESGGPGDLCSDALELALTQHDGGTLYTASVSGSTASLFHHYAATCGGGSGADVVYKVTSPTIGRAVVKLAASFAALVSARTGCEDGKTELACKDSAMGTSGDATEISFPIFANAPVFVMVDGYGGSKGDFLLEVEVQTAFCGNGQAEYPETCDDGNTTDGDGCSSTCVLEDSATTSACPGMGYRVATTASFAGDTSTLSNGGGSASACGPSGTSTNTGGGPNALYAITPTVTGALKLDLLANYPNALLHVRRECMNSVPSPGSPSDSQVDCAAAVEPLTPLSRTIPGFAEQRIYAFVDSNSSSNSGLFTLTATLTPASCGNGIVDGGEQCDDGNQADDDGCSSSCQVEVAPESYTCTGKAVRLAGATPETPGARTLKFHGSTSVVAGLPTSKWGTTTTCGSTSPDVVYQLTSDIDGWLRATVKGTYNTTLSVRASCDAGATTAPLACIREVTGTAPKTLHVAIDKEKPYYIVVDGYSAGLSGSFEVDLEIVPSVCGNGVVEGGETCDDGATDDGDGCSATCQMEVEKARDECSTAPAITLLPVDDGQDGGTYAATVVSGTTNLKHGTAGITGTHTLSGCSSTGPDAWFTVSPPISGVLRATITEAHFRSAIGIRNGCTGTGISQIACDDTVSDVKQGGQQIVVPVEAGTNYRLIVDGQNVTGTVQRGRFTLDVQLAPSACGDTYVAGAEECDDGNTVDGDGCSSSCTIETLPSLAACPGHTVSLTGAGTAPRRGVATVKTTGLGSNVSSTCGGSGPEGIVRVVSNVSGILEARATANFGVLLHARNQCNDPATEIPRASCSSNLGVFTTAVQKDVPVYLFVDGINGAAGVAKVQFTVTP